ncbi:probable E3 ubiquitin-protein ligase RHG1A isoform X2 [Andrographis paniculata]|uniref:probable E3 ubiquitin-protein ligase RHG1A isoform X2 n=1 Tax=Andrographis paniculata TaxID=175694 RepID=UPI0021E7B30F|nr:probable E3 ubiquitin-protein ligase RHG1A isoform X2 [Andrographis paniculata]
MQGERSDVSTTAENVSIDHASMPADVTEPQLLWNGMQPSGQNQLPDYRLSISETNNQYLPHITHDMWNADWSLGESSGSRHQNEENGSKVDTWTFTSPSGLAQEEQGNRSSNNIRALDNVVANSNGNQVTNGLSRLQSSSYAFPQDLNMSSGFGDQEDEGVHQRAGRHIYASAGSSSSSVAPSAAEGSMRFGGRVTEDRPEGSLNGRILPCKRKEIETGQSSGVGSSSFFQNVERNQCPNIRAGAVPAGSVNVQTPMENGPVINNRPQLENPRTRFGFEGAVSTGFFTLTSSFGIDENSQRSCRIQINGVEVADYSFPTEPDTGNTAGSSSQNTRIGPYNHFVDVNPSPAAGNGNLRGQSILDIPSVRRNQQFRWIGPPRTRAITTSSSTTVIQEDGNAAVYEGQPTAANTPIRISEYPMFVSASEMGSSSHNPVNWNMVGGGNNNVAENVAPLPRVGPSTGAGYSVSGISQRNSRRLSQLVRRSLMSSAAAAESGSLSINPEQPRSSAAYQEVGALPHRPDNHLRRAPNSRPLLDRLGAFGGPNSLRSLAAASEGRGGVMSEMRHVLDIMRRGEGLRVGDVMLLDHSVLAGMADIHDRHRDMRLDVDNMSYEELLALEERIGNVCTGLSEETIMARMKHHKHVVGKTAQSEQEPCTICREDYKAEEDVGTLECGHQFHRDCIKEWLLLKNLCPICKTTGLST